MAQKPRRSGSKPHRSSRRSSRSKKTPSKPRSRSRSHRSRSRSRGRSRARSLGEFKEYISKSRSRSHSRGSVRDLEYGAQSLHGMPPQMPMMGLEEPKKSSWGCIIAIVVILILSLAALIGAALWWDWLDLGLWSNKLTVKDNDDTYISDSLRYTPNDYEDDQQDTPAKATPWWKRNVKTTIFLGVLGIASFYLGYDCYNADSGTSILSGWKESVTSTLKSDEEDDTEQVLVHNPTAEDALKLAALCEKDDENCPRRAKTMFLGYGITGAAYYCWYHQWDPFSSLYTKIHEYYLVLRRWCTQTF